MKILKTIGAWISGAMKDLAQDFSSGILVKFLAFLFAIELGILCLAEGVDFGATAAVVGALVTLAIGFQWVQSATGNGTGATKVPTLAAGVPTDKSLGFFAGPDGLPDLGRGIKFAAFLVGVGIVHVAVIWFNGRGGAQPQVFNALGIAGIFWALSTGTEIQQKTTGT